jgi:hypothetical protein
MRQEQPQESHRAISTVAKRLDMHLTGILAVAGGVSALLSGAKWNPAAQSALIQISW